MSERSPRDRRRIRRRVAWVVFALLAVAGIALALVLSGAPLAVEVGEVTRGEHVRYVEEDGRARVRDRYVVSAPLAGTLERVALRVGDDVAVGDVVAILHPVASPLIDPRSRAELEAQRGAAEARLAAARARTAQAEAARVQAERDLARMDQLSRSGVLPSRELERAQLSFTVAVREREAAVELAHLSQHDLQQIRAALRVGSPGGAAEGIELRAPVEGCVLRVYQRSEAVLAPGTPIVELGDPRALEVVVDLLSTDAVRVEPGTEAEITGWGGADSLSGRVTRVEPVAIVRVSALGVEEERVDVIVDPIGTDEGWARVGDGYRVEVRIPIERFEDALRVPTSALFRTGEEWQAFVVRDDIARSVHVALTSYGPIESVVAEGLSEGDRVVLEPPEELIDGTRVEPRRASAP